jgi:hypothetical protein
MAVGNEKFDHYDSVCVKVWIAVLKKFSRSGEGTPFDFPTHRFFCPSILRTSICSSIGEKKNYSSKTFYPLPPLSDCNTTPRHTQLGTGARRPFVEHQKRIKSAEIKVKVTIHIGRLVRF